MRDILDVAAWSALAVLTFGLLVPDKPEPPQVLPPAEPKTFWKITDDAPALSMMDRPPPALPPITKALFTQPTVQPQAKPAPPPIRRASPGCGCGCPDCDGTADCPCNCPNCKCRKSSSPSEHQIITALHKLEARMMALEKRLPAPTKSVVTTAKPVTTQPVVRRYVEPTYYEPTYNVQYSQPMYSQPSYGGGYYGGGNCYGGNCYGGQ